MAATASKQRRTLRILLVLVGLILLITMPRFLYVGDPVAMRMSAAALLERGALDIPTEIARSFGERGQYFCEHPTSGKWYSKYGVLNTLFFVPPLWVESWLADRLAPFEQLSPRGQLLRALLLNLYYIALALVLTSYLYWTACEFNPRPVAAALYVFVALFGTIVWNYLRAHTVEILHLLLFSALFYHLLRAHRAAQPKPTAEDKIQFRRHGAIAIGLAAMMVLARLIFAPLLPMAAIWLAVSNYRAGDRRERFRAGLLLQWQRHGRFFLGAIAAAVSVSTALVLLQNWWCFGSIASTGYHQWTRFDTLFTWDLRTGLYGFFLHPQKSLAIYFPLLLFALPASLFFFRQRLWEFSFLWTAALGFLLVFAAYRDWHGGWCYGPRYLVFLLPTVGLMGLDAVDRLHKSQRGRWLTALAAAALLVVSLRTHLLVHNMEFMMPYRLAGILRDPTVVEGSDPYFDRQPFWVILRDYVEYRAGRGPFPPLSRFRLGTAARRRAEVETALRSLPVGNMLWLRSAVRPPAVAREP